MVVTCVSGGMTQDTQCPRRKLAYDKRDLHVGFYRLSTNVQLGGKCRQIVPPGPKEAGGHEV